MKPNKIVRVDIMEDLMEILKKVGQAVIWIAFLVAFASIGFASEIPGIMVPLLALIFIGVVVGIVFNLSRNKRHSYEKLGNPVIINLIGGGVILLFSLVFPLIGFTNLRPDLIPKAMIFVFTIILTLVGFASVYLINVMGIKKKIYTLLGFILLTITASIPALIIARIDSTFGTLGTVYFIMLLQAILVWSGFFMFYKKFRPAE